MATTFAHNDDSVVVVIGSGAGGGTLSHDLTRRGINVVCLEAGPRLEANTFVNDYNTMFMRLSWLDKRIGEGELLAGLPAWICKVVGGTSVHWNAVALRFRSQDFRTKTLFGNIEGANLADWPISYAELDPYYAMAERRMGVTGINGNPPMPQNNAGLVMEHGARKLGFKKVGASRMAINSKNRDGRPACKQIGFCDTGCVIGAKWSTLYVDVPKAEKTGHFELRPECMALKLNHDATGRVVSVTYVDKDKKIHEQKCRAVAVAGNAIETPRLLLNSASSMFPNGMANSSGQVGKNYMTHVSAGIYAFMPGEVYGDRGTQMNGIISDMEANNEKRGFVGGYHLERLPVFGFPWFPSFLKPGAWGQEYAGWVEQYRNAVNMWVCGEDLPQQANGVTLHATEKDQHDMPVPVVRYNSHANDKAMQQHAIKTGTDVWNAAGAKKVFERGPWPASHNMGTARMSAKAGDGVVNKYGRAHDIPNLFISDGSQFTTSSANNPTLTIVALAIRQAEHIAGLMSRKEL